MSTSAGDSRLQNLLGAAEQADLQGRRDEAARLLSEARAIAPGNAAVLNACGVHALRKGDASEAKVLLERAIAANPGSPSLHINLATCLRTLDDAEGESKALERALTLNPYFFEALMQRASLFERMGKTRQAARAYHRALCSLRPDTSLPPSFQPLMEHARRLIQTSLQELDACLQERMRDVRARHSSASQERVDDCLGALLGKNRIYVQQPMLVHFPRLPAIQFYDREQFPWLRQVEQATDDIRAELLGLLEDVRTSFVPYIDYPDDEPLNQWRELNRSPRWSALFLFKNGKRQDAVADRCPRTLAALEGAPVVAIPEAGPTSFFSLLEPHTRIPAHTGGTNTRVIVHLPLIVPPKCGFRVGTQIREWQPGTALIFDDTIEHEAWNESDEERVILIFDIWNPLLTPAERDLMTAATTAMADFYEDAAGLGS